MVTYTAGNLLNGYIVPEQKSMSGGDIARGEIAVNE